MLLSVEAGASYYSMGISYHIAVAQFFYTDTLAADVSASQCDI